MTDTLAERMANRAGRAVGVMEERADTHPRIHPAAAVFPRLPDDDLAELAADIKANGLHHPIVLDSEGRIVDGINRDIACDMAGVDKHYITLPPETDILAYILSENIRRRHMSKGQQAMAIAEMIETEEGKRDGTATRLSRESLLDKQWTSHAVTIRRYAPDLAPGILAGTEKFDAAYKSALARKKDREDEVSASERKAHEDRIRLERLRRSRPDLASLVPDTLSLDAALAAAAEDDRQRAAEKESQSRLMDTVLNALDPGIRATPSEKAGTIAGRLDAASLPIRPDFSPERIRRARDTLSALLTILGDREDTDGRVPAS